MEVRRLADALAEGGVEKASVHVASALQAHRHTLHTLQAFLHDNHQLTKLVQDLPDKVFHAVMVPFGKAAFFPGRLVHTNEFLVLLGEGYYAECSASRTLNILERRDKFLCSQIAGVNLQIADLDVESRFFTETLAEAADGYVEIREEYVESLSLASTTNAEVGCLQAAESDGASSRLRMEEGWTESNEMWPSIEDREHKILMARLDELEAAEAAASWDVSNPGSSSDTAYLRPVKLDCDPFIRDGGQKVEENGVLTLRVNEPDPSTADHSQAKEFCDRGGGSLKGRPSLQSPGDILKFEEWRLLTSREENANQTTDVKSKASNPPAAHQLEDEHRVATLSQTGTLKAFTGTVLERSAPSLLIKPPQDETQAPNRPASKFKMRQRTK